MLGFHHQGERRDDRVGAPADGAGVIMLGPLGGRVNPPELPGGGAIAVAPLAEVGGGGVVPTSVGVSCRS